MFVSHEVTNSLCSPIGKVSALRWTGTRPRGYKTFFMLNLTEHEIYPNKCLAIVGILTFVITYQDKCLTLMIQTGKFH